MYEQGRNQLWKPVLLLLLGVTSLVKSQESEDPSQQADGIIQDFWEWRLKESPEYGTKFGDRRYDDKISEWTEDSFVRILEGAIKLKNRVVSIRREGLDDQRSISLQILEANLQTFIDGFPYRKYGMYSMLAPLEAPTSYWSTLMGRNRYESADDFRKALARLKLLPTYVNQRINLLNNGIESGLTLHEASLTTLDDKFAGEIVTDPEKSTMFKKMFGKEMPSDMSQKEWDNFKAEAKSFILSDVVPAWEKFRNYLASNYTKHTRPKEGVFSLPGGLDYYKACLRWHLSVDISPEEVHQTGLDEVQRIAALMEAEMRKDNFDGTLQEYIVHLKNQPDNFFKTEDEMFQGYKDIVESVRDKIKNVLPESKIPKAPLSFAKNTNPAGSTGFYSDPPLDGSRNGTFITNVFDPETKPKFDMVVLALHEAEPGHHTQAAFALEADMPNFRRAIEYYNYGGVPFNWPFYTAYSEGWALYAEALGEEMGIYNTNHSLFGRYTSEIFRSTRLVVDTGIHAFGWSKERAIDYVANYTTLTRKAITNEINRYISWPGQACAYKIGQLKISSLREDASKKLGGKFDLKQFHVEVLKLGNAPMVLLEEQISKWVDSQLESKNKDSQTCGGERAASVFLLVPLALTWTIAAAL